jgi:hypothetical protein
MMFGDKPASNWAMRLSGSIAHATAVVANSFQPATESVRTAFRVIETLQQAGDDHRCIHTFVSCFIDDFPL